MSPDTLSLAKQLFGTSDLYEVLGAERTATSGELKKAYYKVALKVHPDRCSTSEKEEATTKFQVIGRAYAILSDKEKRAVYDETGEIDEENAASNENKDWEEYCRALFKKVTTKDIEEFEKKYRGSDLEKQDLQQAYTEAEGDMDVILENVMCSRIEDEDRFREIIDDLIAQGTLQKFKAYNKNKKKRDQRKRKAEKEAEEAEKAAQELGFKKNATDDDLASLILAKRAQRTDDLISRLEAKYSSSGAGTKKKAKTK
eukprot:Colp12_sorted_trinity150504_noHs@13977